MYKKFSSKVKQVISRSREEAIRLGHDYIGTEHLLLGIVYDKESLAVKVLEMLAVDTSELKQTIEDAILGYGAPKTTLNVGNIPLNRQAEKVLKVTLLEAKMLRSEEVESEHLMLSILKQRDTIATRILNELNIDYDLYKSDTIGVIFNENE